MASVASLAGSSLSSEHRLHRYRQLGEVLAASLRIFSLDVVAVVADYIGMFGPPQPGAQPQLLLEFGSKGDGTNGSFRSACYAVACDGDSNIYVGCDQSAQMFDCNGTFLHRLSELGSCGMAVDDKMNEVFITIYTGTLIVCDKTGRQLRAFGKRQLREMSQPWGVALGGDGLVYVVDYNLGRVRCFSRGGQIGHTSADYLVQARGIAISAKGEMFVAEETPPSRPSRPRVFDLQGKVLRQLAEPLSLGSIAVGEDGVLVCCGAMAPAVLVLRPDGTKITSFEMPTPTNVWSVALTKDWRIIVGCSDCRVRVFGFPVG